MNPFPGLRPFTQEEDYLFFGREEQTLELLQRLRELLKATGYGRPAPIGVQAVYVAPPDDRRKERFQSHQAAVIRQPGDFEPSAELDTFVSQIQAASI